MRRAIIPLQRVTNGVANTVDRTKGEEAAVSGYGFRVTRGIPPFDLAVSFNGQDGERIPVRAGENYFAAFRSLWFFHSAPTGSLQYESFEIVAYSSPGESIQGVNPANTGYTARTAVYMGINTGGLRQLVAAPPKGYRIRLLAYRYTFSADITQAAAGVVEYAMAEQGVNFAEASHLLYIPAAVPAGASGGFDTGWVDLGPEGVVLGEAHALQWAAGGALTTGKAGCVVKYIIEASPVSLLPLP